MRELIFFAGALAFVSPAAAGTPSADLASPELPITSPDFEPMVGVDLPPAAIGLHIPGTLFINFDGADMQSCGGTNFPQDNCSTVMQDTVLPYSGGAAQRAAVVQIMAADVEPFAIEVVDVRPAREVDYDMVMVGDWEPAAQGGFAGVAPTIDCWNYVRGETSFSLDFGDPSTVAKIVGQEAAHVWGLEHVDSPGDLLYPTIGGAPDPEFEDICYQIVVIDGGLVPAEANCPEQHAVACPDQPNYQNSYEEMMMVFGPKLPDVVAPTLQIVSPMEGESLPTGGNFDIQIEMVDDTSQLFDVFVSLDVDEMGAQVGNVPYAGPDLGIPVMGVSDGQHLVRVDVVDLSGNVATDLVHFAIGEPAEPPAESSGSSGGSDGGADGTTGVGTTATASASEGVSASADEGSGESTSGGEDQEKSGCGCSAAPRGGWLFVGIVLLALRRRSAAKGQRDPERLA